MDRTSFDHFTYTTMPIEDTLLHKVNRNAYGHLSWMKIKMEDSWTRFNVYVWLGIKEAGKKIYFIVPITHSKEENLSVCQELFDLRPSKSRLCSILPASTSNRLVFKLARCRSLSRRT